jgi:LmbE family N-acetylglucosaminyl deacetylase
MHMIRRLSFGIFILLIGPGLHAQPPPDERMKADILLIVAHPDDETAVGSYLAKAVYDEGRQIAIVYCNRGSGGGNSAGIEQAGAMGAIREIEARRAAATFGITNVWFLNGRDTPGQDLFRSLREWHHGAMLEDLVRLVRLTRPEVVLTWLPDVVAGENHGDHQAAGVLAVEAFDCAGDPTVYPGQVTPPRERSDINNATEGLHPWQPKKIYFFSDASHEIAADGPPFDLAATSPSQKQPYYMLAAKLHLSHLTQGDVSQVAIEAFRTGDFTAFRKWLGKFHLIFGKSVVPTRPGADVFEGIAPVPFTRPPGYTLVQQKGIVLELGGAFAFYREFWQAHGIGNIAPLVPPEIEVAAGSYLHVPLLVRNGTEDTISVTLASSLQEGWTEASGSGTYRVNPGESYPVQTFIQCPSSVTSGPVAVKWKAVIDKKETGAAFLMVTLVEWALPQ